jgi:hypothetical protein
MRNKPKNKRRFTSVKAALFFTGLGLLLFSIPYLVKADLGIDDLYSCPDGYPEGPAFTDHIEQEEIVNGSLIFDDILDIGEKLFIVDFNTCDGRGRPATTGGGAKRSPEGQPPFLRTSAPDSNSCSGCHNEPSAGGGGDFVVNVFVLAQTLDPVTESVNGEFSNERNTLGMFGAGPIEMLAREMTTELHAIRDEAIASAQESGQTVREVLVAKGISFGTLIVNADGSIDPSEIEGIDHDLIVKPFHQAGKVISLREFTNNAMNHHHGMQSEERFDLNPDKGVDFDEDGIPRELTIGDMTAVSLWQASLATPGRLMPAEGTEVVAQGEALFAEIGCTSCHLPELVLDSPMFVEPNPFNPAGNFSDTSMSVSFDMTKEGLNQRLEAQGGGAIVRAYTDLKRHDLCDDPDEPDAIRFFCNEQLAQERPDQNGKPGTEFFLTRKLWDVGNSGPYGHRGDLTTITEAILVHGGEARDSRDAFVALSTDDQAAIISFLKTLQVLPPGTDLIMSEGDTDATSPMDGISTNTLLIIIGVLAVLLVISVLMMLRRGPQAKVK